MIIGRKSKYIQELFTDLHTLCNQKRLAVIPDKLISTSRRSTHFSLVCFVLFLFFFFPANPSCKVAFRIISCDLLYNEVYACLYCSSVSLGVKYSKDKAFKRKQELLQTEASLKQAEETLISDPSASNLEALEKLKNKYDSHFDYIAKGAIVRSRATWYEQGRKGNKYFLGLESNRKEELYSQDVYYTSKGTLISH